MALNDTFYYKIKFAESQTFFLESNVQDELSLTEKLRKKTAMKFIANDQSESSEAFVGDKLISVKRVKKTSIGNQENVWKLV